MKTAFLLLARRGANSDINRWLNENPVVLGLLALAIGSALGLSGVYELRKGVSRDKYGNEIRGGMGSFVSILRFVFGVLACGFGAYKIYVGITG